MKNKILSVVVSASVVFSAGTAASAEKLESSVMPVILESCSDAQIDIGTQVPFENLISPAVERFNVAESVQEISEIPTHEKSPVIENTTQPENSSTSYNESDLYWLSRIIEAEASGESTSGKVAVGNCVLNRVKSSEFPNTIYGVIFDTKHGVQYQPTANGAIYNTPSEESVQAAKDALNGHSVVGEAMYFCSTKVAPTSWASKNRPYLTTIGNHVFYL